jgi:hypothetical protein
MTSSLAEQAQDAFPRTARHDADARVRLVRTPEDMVVIHHPQVMAAILKQDTPPAIAAALQGIRSPNDAHALMAEQSALDDLMDLALMFEKATGRISRNARLKPTYYKPGNLELVIKMDSTLPHFDEGFRFRMLKAHTPDPKYGTEWYPGDISRQQLETRVLQFINAQDPAPLKADMNVQRVEPGSVLLLKGEAKSWSELLIHNAPTPKAETPRLLTMVW